jgi:outer membrane protein
LAGGLGRTSRLAARVLTAVLLLATCCLAVEPGPPSSENSAEIVCRLPPIETVATPPGTVDAAAEALDQAWAAALAFDQSLEARRWDALAAEQHWLGARAERFPNADLDSSYRVRSARPAFSSRYWNLPLPTESLPYGQREAFAFRGIVELPLYTSGRIARGIDAAAADASAAALEVDKSRMDLRLAVAEEYVAVLYAQRDVELAQSTVRSLESHARDVRQLFDHERAPKNDLLAAEVALSNARQQAIQADNHLDVCRAAYNRRLGRPLANPVSIAELPPSDADMDLERLMARAAERRPESAILSARARAVESQADGALASRLPQVNLQGEYAFEENRYQATEGIAAVGVGVGWNVFDSGRRSHQATELRQRAESLRRDRADVESTIQLDVRRAWLDVQETKRRVEVARQSLEQAEENLRVARNRYMAGLSISTEVLDAETLRTQAHANHFSAIYGAALASLRLRHATGDLR